MRFLADGPSIPDELLLARDEGRVVFFCGAGVSQAKAGLVDFVKLAQRVVADLGVQEDDPASLILAALRKLDEVPGAGSLISIDQVFGALERDFLQRDVEASVSKVLRSADDVDLSAHDLLVDLATTQEGFIQLVTTNFDRLFERCRPQATVWEAPRLPDVQTDQIIDGIVHLHGVVNPNYTGPSGPSFVLSNAQFGKAYMSDGWATRFIRNIFGKYVVVFVGYAADDPPVRYLLEALRTDQNEDRRAFAFQSSNEKEVLARWAQKGVNAIEYDASNDRSALWETLSKWAERARDVDGWYDRVIAASLNGPASMQPYERGQLAHIVSSSYGARRFAQSAKPAPAEWLCVFDPQIRYLTPSRGSPDGPVFDPFMAFGLDSDQAPDPPSPGNPYKKREVPVGSWSCFDVHGADYRDIGKENTASLNGFTSTHTALLPKRINFIGHWIINISDQPACAWWAAHQYGLHRQVFEGIDRRLRVEADAFDQEISKYWSYLFESWNSKRENSDRDFLELKRKLHRHGWGGNLIREFIDLSAPYFSVSRNYYRRGGPPEAGEELQFNDLARFDVEYPSPRGEIKVPDEHLVRVAKAFRGNLELAVALERELGGYGLNALPPMLRWEDADRHDKPVRHLSDMDTYILFFTEMFKRLVELSPDQARKELGSWPEDDDTVFARLRIWVVGAFDLLNGKEVAGVINGLSDEAFWDLRHQRDLLICLVTQWNAMDDDGVKLLAERILSGPNQWPREEENEYQERRSGDILERILFLAREGCHFHFEINDIAQKLIEKAPRWKDEFIDRAIFNYAPRVGFVGTDKSHDQLENIPLPQLLARVDEETGRDRDAWVEKDPFAGFAKDKPLRAYSALAYEARNGRYPEREWRTFLSFDNRTDDPARLKKLIAERLVRIPANEIIPIAQSAADWLNRSADALTTSSPKSFDGLAAHLIEVIRSAPGDFGSSLVRSDRERDYVSAAINSPVGKIAEALMNDVRAKEADSFPEPWLKTWEALFELPDGLKYHALPLATFNLNWFFHHAEDWTAEHILRRLDTDKDAGDAIWAGILWNAELPLSGLFKLLRASLIDQATTRTLARRGYTENLAGFVLGGWGLVGREENDPIFSDAEAREILLKAGDDFRHQVLRLLKRWGGGDGQPNNPWPQLLPVFLQNVWPRQVAVRTKAVSSALCDIAFTLEDRFGEIVDIILPLVSKIDEHFFLPEMRKSGGEIVYRFPFKALALLYEVLPTNASFWPYGIEKIIDAFEECDEAVRRDWRFVELKRRWNSR